MAVTAKMYGNALLKALAKEVDWTADTIKVALLANTFTPDQDTQDYFDDVVAQEVSGTGYTAGGATLTTATATYDAASNTITLDADDVSWPNSTITAAYAVVYDDTPATNAEKPLLGYVDFGGEQSSSNGTFDLVWDAAGIFTVTVA